MHSINTYYGNTINYLRPAADQIDIRDIAHNLSFENRFIGKTEQPYSVAQHCVLGSRLFEEMGYPDLALQFLLHDATEAYLKDIPTPLKHILGTIYSDIEDEFHGVIARKFGLPEQIGSQVKKMDLAMLAAEKEQLLQSDHTVEWTQLAGITAANIYIVPWEYLRAEHEFMAQYQVLQKVLEEDESWQA